jgi:hypothetical protein
MRAKGFDRNFYHLFFTLSFVDVKLKCKFTLGIPQLLFFSNKV